MEAGWIDITKPIWRVLQNCCGTPTGLCSKNTHALPVHQGRPTGVTPGRAGCSAHCGRTNHQPRGGCACAASSAAGSQREPGDHGHVTAEAPGAEPRGGCGLPGAAPTCPCGPGECGSPCGLTCLRPPPPNAHYVMPRHAPAQPTGARAAERKHTAHVARAAGPCEGGGRSAGSRARDPGGPTRDSRTHARGAEPRASLPLLPAFSSMALGGVRPSPRRPGLQAVGFAGPPHELRARAAPADLPAEARCSGFLRQRSAAGTAADGEGASTM